MLFVREPWWGTGLATRLLARAVAEAQARGYGAMRLHTPGEHRRARRFYEREGWTADDPAFYEPMLGLTLVTYRRALVPDVPGSPGWRTTPSPGASPSGSVP
jgi:ribosomal protein S18 acetylase RimI-like enzyme